MAAKRKSSGRSMKQTPQGAELLALELQEIHSAENQLSKALPQLSRAAESRRLRAHLDERLKQGRRVMKDVEAALKEVDGNSSRRKNVAVEGLINDARQHVQQLSAGPALDSVLISSMQKTEHYCIAAWGTAKALAESLGHTRAVRSMERSLKEGKTFDERLTQLAEREVTPMLISGEEEETEQSSRSARGRRQQRSRASSKRHVTH